MSEWLTVRRGEAPLVVSLPHTGTEIPAPFDLDLVDPWLARKDADWWIDRLYDFAGDLGATIVHTAISRTVIDVNRDPSGVSLYPGQATTELCPATTFDGEPLYKSETPDAAAIAVRRGKYFDPYHDALAAELARLRKSHGKIVLYDCHSIRSVIPRLFDGELPEMNIGTNSGASCEPALTAAIAEHARAAGFSHVVNGRFKGGFITRNFGNPQTGVHAVQMELACRSYMHEPLGPVSETDWPSSYDEQTAARMRATLEKILNTCIEFAKS
jgi:N-formylglutamate deformylase